MSRFCIALILAGATLWGADSRSEFERVKGDLDGAGEDLSYSIARQIAVNHARHGDALQAFTWAMNEARPRIRASALLGISEALIQRAGLAAFSNDGT